MSYNPVEDFGWEHPAALKRECSIVTQSQSSGPASERQAADAGEDSGWVFVCLFSLFDVFRGQRRGECEKEPVSGLAEGRK